MFENISNCENLPIVSDAGQEISMQGELISEYYCKRVDEITQDEACCWICDFSAKFRQIWDNGFKTKKAIEKILYNQ